MSTGNPSLEDDSLAAQQAKAAGSAPSTSGATAAEQGTVSHAQLLAVVRQLQDQTAQAMEGILQRIVAAQQPGRQTRSTTRNPPTTTIASEDIRRFFSVPVTTAPFQPFGQHQHLLQPGTPIIPSAPSATGSVADPPVVPVPLFQLQASTILFCLLYLQTQSSHQSQRIIKPSSPSSTSLLMPSKTLALQQPEICTKLRIYNHTGRFGNCYQKTVAQKSGPAFSSSIWWPDMGGLKLIVSTQAILHPIVCQWIQQPSLLLRLRGEARGPGLLPMLPPDPNNTEGAQDSSSNKNDGQDNNSSHSSNQPLLPDHEDPIELKFIQPTSLRDPRRSTYLSSSTPLDLPTPRFDTLAARPLAALLQPQTAPGTSDVLFRIIQQVGIPTEPQRKPWKKLTLTFKSRLPSPTRLLLLPLQHVHHMKKNDATLHGESLHSLTAQVSRRGHLWKHNSHRHGNIFRTFALSNTTTGFQLIFLKKGQLTGNNLQLYSTSHR